jgi:hypothetical protein
MQEMLAINHGVVTHLGELVNLKFHVEGALLGKSRHGKRVTRWRFLRSV